MILDISIILGYFTVIMGIGIRARVRKDVTAEGVLLERTFSEVALDCHVDHCH